MLNIENLVPNTQFDGHYKLIRPLSTDGGTADVWLALDTNTIDNPDSLEDIENSEMTNDSGMLVAIKIYRPKNALDIEGEQRFRDEFKIVYECRHENLVQPTSFSIYEDIPYLVLPYCKYGSSEQLINKGLSNDEIWKFILDVSSGLNRLHTNNPQIIHQDIKPANVLIDNNKDYAITDFGISSKRGIYNESYYNESNSGTLAYMAPERFNQNAEPIPQSDIWAFGATLYEILTGDVPFGETGGKQQLMKDCEIPEIKNIPNDIQHLIHACLSKDPKLRPTAYDIQQAAIAKKFPLKKIRLIHFVIAFVVICIIGFFYIKNNNDINTKNEIPSEELYNIALKRLNTDDYKTMKSGIELMDTLSNKKYIPAIYQMAFTYGWYTDSISIHRKEVLGIDYFDIKYKGLPKSKEYNTKAIALLQNILDINDSTYALINAKAAYRLACYYVNPNPFFNKGQYFLEVSKKWAIKTNDSTLLRNIYRSLESFKN